MFKLVVLSALVAVAVARPSGITAHSAIVAPAVVGYAAIPSAVSHQFRSDVIVSNPVVTAHVAPAVVAAPVAVPAAVSHSYRSDIISQPAVAVHAAPLALAAHHVPAVHAW